LISLLANSYASGISRNKVLIIIILIAVFYISFAIYSDANKLVYHFWNINIRYLFPILLSFSATIFIKGIRQFLLLRTIGIRMEFKENLLIYLGGLSLIATPFGIGQMVKSYFLFKKYDQPIPKTVPVVILERYHDMLALFCFMAILLLIGNIKILEIPILIGGILLLLAIILIKRVELIRFIQKKLSRVKFLAMSEDSSLALSTSFNLLTSHRILFYCWLVSMAAWFFEAVGIFLCFKSFDLSFDFIFTTAFGFSSVFFGAISFIPAGAGITEVIFVQLLSSYGLELSLATAVVIFYRLCSIWYSTCIGVVAANYLLKDKVYNKH
jgi:uncharacterized protein (TIRG00374 family)